MEQGNRKIEFCRGPNTVLVEGVPQEGAIDPNAKGVGGKGERKTM